MCKAVFRPLFLILFKKLARAPAILCRLEDWFESITTHSYLKKCNLVPILAGGSINSSKYYIDSVLHLFINLDKPVCTNEKHWNLFDSVNYRPRKKSK